MAEAVGIAFAIIPLIVPAYRGYERCAEILQDIRFHTKAFKSCSREFTVQKGIFEFECELLLSSAVNNPVAREMLRDETHPGWRDSRFVSWCNDNASDPLRVAFATSLETLDEIVERLAKGKGTNGLQQDLAGSSNSLAIIDRMPSPSSMASGIHGYSDAKRIVAWAISGKPRVEELLKTLKRQNKSFSTLRMQNSKLQKARSHGNAAPRKLLIRDSRRLTTPENTGSSEVFAIRDFAKRLNEGLASTASCPCHKVNLRLENITSHCRADREARDPLTRRIKLRLVITPNTTLLSDSPEPECDCVLIESEWRIEDQNLPQNPPKDDPVRVKSSWKRKASIDDSEMAPPTAKLVRLTFDTITSVNAAQPSLLAQMSGASTAMPFDTRILSLCSALASARSPSKSPHYLGFIRSSMGSSCQNFLYKECESYPPSSRMSLSCLLSPTGRKYFPSRLERLRMAFVLSLSILEFGSFLSPWFQDHWRSRDIYFFLENRDIDPVSNGPTQYPSSLSFAPHISALFDTGVVAIPRRSLARNNQLFSLAVVLTEIAFGKPLADIESPSGIPTFGQEDIISEYVKLKDIIDTRLAGEIGQKYATVVERLFYCEFGLDLVRDFTKKEMQVQYYGMVVGKLEECVKVLEQLDED